MSTITYSGQYSSTNRRADIVRNHEDEMDSLMTHLYDDDAEEMNREVNSHPEHLQDILKKHFNAHRRFAYTP